MNLLDTVKRSLILFFLGLPLIIIIIVFFLGLGLGNAGLLFLSLGQILLVPTAVAAFHFVGEFLGDYTKLPYSDILQLVPSQPVSGSTTYINVWPSYWMAHFAFFSAYILSNAIDVYKLDPVSDSAEYNVKVQSRKSRATIIITFTVVFFAVLSAIRYAYTGSEHIIGAFIGTAAFGLLGWGWYTASATLGIRTMDIFGIAQQMVVTQDPSRPTTCVSS